jgi:chemotaxis protein MotB
MWRWRNGCRSSTATGRTSSAGCVKSCQAAKMCVLSATVSCSSRKVLFPSGGNELNPAGQEQMAKLAEAINELSREIPEEINWVLRVDGHTDNVPLSGTGRYADNWELSTARATSVVKYLIANGVPANRLVAAGFGEFQPIADGDSDEARATNRRIELKLTER